MRLPGPSEIFALFDDARVRGAAPARLYRDPVGIIAAHRMEEVQPALDRLADARENGLHVAGYMTYEAGLALEDRLAPVAARAEAKGGAAPLLWFGLFEGVRLIAPGTLPDLLPDPAGASVTPPRPLIDEAEYRAAFDAVQDYIRAGDIYQANLTFPCETRVSGDPMALYAAVRPRAAAGYGGVIRTGGQALLSFSPELFFTLVRGQLTARPMKGTATRHADPQQDTALAQWLQSDAKQRAENLMIVDLLRNDLSRVSRAGSVTVPDLFKVESYPTVHQLVSTVRARILPGLSPVDVLRVLFPCGSITGAPKVRAMEILDALEPHARGVYTGSMGWIDPDGDAAFNVAIRTLTIDEGAGVGRLGLGSGLVVDSEAGSEWAECLAKGRFLAGA
ncbi:MULTISPECIES: aminodeoxychorismate synthase component I [unclassified Sphingobium]|uniref:aminodeoxychorismate synthase component I n=1 Tax=unclassified Sphingobium TaxID=2611147 RepID=UPI000D165243|nr:MULTISPECIES: aminodeoxychorismate synthase component I [unclassified Sphingobium]MBG6119184.1 aminodeoxychorismate synthase component I [Sphingobium sp. JAI105]PSO09646.1 aminodeoxychorismate synthase, component I [Sphingobium sp. AEW4]TWC97300.1 para-aminobenzoate synthetase component 1 [Sphingobium sp. AEW010]TWD17745.1 para-aminobenzoate synthetase component 1 [Sphingobium sp. AEW013]TWD19998.1 para-aminobenzoate synthetase component 1 [Sphingobium sp. AEW001]